MCFSEFLQEEFKGWCEKEKIPAKICVVENVQNIAGLIKNTEM
jgi:hypothetical protein